MTRRYIVDPPEGWKYGFPKEAPQLTSANWFLSQGYPQHLIDGGMLEYVRFWYEDNENKESLK